MTMRHPLRGSATSADPRAEQSGDRSRTARWHARFLVEERYADPRARRRTYRLSAALIVVGAVAFAVLLIGVLTHTGPQLLDRPIEQWFDAGRSQDATGVMTVLAIVFGPVGMPVIVAAVLIVWIVLARHLWRPILLFGGMVTGLVLAQVLAPVVRHPRPPIGLMLLGPDHTFSFPSGHVLGMSDFFLISAYLLASRVRRRWLTVTTVLIAIAVVLAQVTSRLYLGYHWFTDVSASIALSLVILGVIIAIDTRRTVRLPGEPLRGERSTRQVDGT
ncbi:MAG: phosphatase PAP2 family protein [Actinomycetota bacterium]|nr:phosphatase PAP2 family protein [Actinomycetota bacterium]